MQANIAVHIFRSIYNTRPAKRLRELLIRYGVKLLLLILVSACGERPIQLLTTVRYFEPIDRMVLWPPLPSLLLLLLHDVVDSRDAWASSKVSLRCWVESDFRLVVSQLVEASICVLLLVHHHALGADAPTIILGGGFCRALRTRRSSLVLTLISKTIDLNHNSLLATHGGLVLTRCISRCA